MQRLLLWQTWKSVRILFLSNVSSHLMRCKSLRTCAERIWCLGASLENWVLEMTNAVMSHKPMPTVPRRGYFQMLASHG